MRTALDDIRRAPRRLYLERRRTDVDTSDDRTNEPIQATILIADDHAMIREGLAAVCQSRSLQVVAQCGDGLTALEMARALRPDFAILDLNMPKLNGLEVIRRIRESESPTRCIVLTVSRDEDSLREALRAGADGYLLKGGPFRHLTDAIKEIRNGGVYVSPQLRFKAAPENPEGDPLEQLSRRERDVFFGLVGGLRAQEIATLLDISPKTVDTYRAGLMRKLDIHDVAGLVEFAIARNLSSTAT